MFDSPPAQIARRHPPARNARPLSSTAISHRRSPSSSSVRRSLTPRTATVSRKDGRFFTRPVRSRVLRPSTPSSSEPNLSRMHRHSSDQTPAQPSRRRRPHSRGPPTQPQARVAPSSPPATPQVFHHTAHIPTSALRQHFDAEPEMPVFQGQRRVIPLHHLPQPFGFEEDSDSVVSYELDFDSFQDSDDSDDSVDVYDRPGITRPRDEAFDSDSDSDVPEPARKRARTETSERPGPSAGPSSSTTLPVPPRARVRLPHIHRAHHSFFRFGPAFAEESDDDVVEVTSRRTSANTSLGDLEQMEQDRLLALQLQHQEDVMLRTHMIFQARRMHMPERDDGDEGEPIHHRLIRVLGMPREVPSRVDPALLRLSLSDRDFDENDYETLLMLDELNGVKTGASQAAKEVMITTKEASTTHIGKKCPVCLEKFEEKAKISTIICEHFYHEECLDNWISSHKTCPVCRLEIDGNVPQSK